MVKKTTIIFGLILVFLLTININVFSMSAQEWSEDIDFLGDNLPILHKNLFTRISEEEFNNELLSLKGELGDLTDLGTTLHLMEIFANLGDSHTGISFIKYISQYYPLFFQKFGNDFYVVAVHSEYSGLIGARLSAINGQSIEEVLGKLNRIITSDNQAAIAYTAQDYLNLPEILRYTGVIDDSIRYTFDTAVGEVNFSPDEYYIRELRNKEIKSVDYKPGIAYKNSTKLFWYQYIPDDNLIYFQYNKCWSRELEEKLTGEVNMILPSFDETVNEILELIRKEDVKKLVIDLRHNSGGSSAPGSRLAEMLSELENKPDIYVVIGNRTYSSAIINAVDFKVEAGAVLIGEPTRGKPNHFGEVRSFSLPNSNITVAYSTKYFRLLDDDSDALYPDIYVPENYYDFVDGKDTILERINDL